MNNEKSTAEDLAPIPAPATQRLEQALKWIASDAAEQAQDYLDETVAPEGGE